MVNPSIDLQMCRVIPWLCGGLKIAPFYSIDISAFFFSSAKAQSTFDFALTHGKRLIL